MNGLDIFFKFGGLLCRYRDWTIQQLPLHRLNSNQANLSALNLTSNNDLNTFCIIYWGGSDNIALLDVCLYNSRVMNPTPSKIVTLNNGCKEMQRQTAMIVIYLQLKHEVISITNSQRKTSWCYFNMKMLQTGWLDSSIDDLCFHYIARKCPNIETLKETNSTVDTQLGL